MLHYFKNQNQKYKPITPEFQQKRMRPFDITTHSNSIGKGLSSIFIYSEDRAYFTFFKSFFSENCHIVVPLHSQISIFNSNNSHHKLHT